MSYMIQDVRTIAPACSEFGIDTPQAVKDAVAAHEAAAQLLTEVRAERDIDMATITAKNLREIHARMVDWDTHGAREKAAARIESELSGRVLSVWMVATHGLFEAFRAPFDTAAHDFVTALDELHDDLDPMHAISSGMHEAYQRMTGAAARLGTLTRVRDALGRATPLDAGHKGVEELGRILHLPDFRTANQVIPHETSGDRMVGRVSHARGETGWFAVVCRIPGVQIKWHTRSEQQTFAELRANDPDVRRAA